MRIEEAHLFVPALIFCRKHENTEALAIALFVFVYNFLLLPMISLYLIKILILENRISLCQMAFSILSCFLIFFQILIPTLANSLVFLLSHMLINCYSFSWLHEKKKIFLQGCVWWIPTLFPGGFLQGFLCCYHISSLLSSGNLSDPYWDRSSEFYLTKALSFHVSPEPHFIGLQ